MNIIFFGTPQFSVIILQKLIESGFMPIAVVTIPDKPADRGQKLTNQPVKIIANEYTIPVLQPQKLDENFRFQVSGFKPTVFVIAAYGKILPASLLNIPLKGTINVHPSLLPRHRGPSPIQTTILAGDEYAGVTLMLTDEKMDHGPIIATISLQIASSKITYTELHNKLAELAGDLLLETLPKWIAGEIKPQEQEHEKATYTKLLIKTDGHIDWSKSAKEIDRMVRALNPWPGTWNYMGFSRIPEVEHPEFKRVKILAGKPTDEPSTASPGMLIKTKSGQLAACTRDVLYVIEKLQLEGKKPAMNFSSLIPLMLF